MSEIEDALDTIDDTLAEIKGWQERHETRHNDDQRLLASIVDSLSAHQTNHHGLVSKVKTSGLATFFAGIIIAFIELARLLTG